MKQSLKYLLVFASFTLLFYSGFAQAGWWTWVKGDTSLSFDSSRYGIRGIPSPLNDPCGRYEPVEWTDQEGNFWIFGGTDKYYQKGFNDLWRYNPYTNEWTWMHGDTTYHNSNDSNNTTLPRFGTKGIAAPENTPGALWYGAQSWTDLNGNLWLYGGFGPDSFGDEGFMSALWKYDIKDNQWIWVHGSSKKNIYPVRGNIGIGASENTPGGRAECAATWTDKNGNLWLFGGQCSDSGGTWCGDMWKYSIASNQWTWMHGFDKPVKYGIYGIKGVSSSQNKPGTRMVYSRWKDKDGNFWIYGGNGTGGLGQSGHLNDLWRYNPSINEWTWMHGDSIANKLPVYGQLCNPNPTNTPGARFEGRATWSDSSGLWLYGGVTSGYAKKDLWKYLIDSNQWVWVGGLKGNYSSMSGLLTDSSANVIYGTQGVADSLNSPGSNFGSVSWTDTSGNLWFFGNAARGMWKYAPDCKCYGNIIIKEEVSVNNDTTICNPACIELKAEGAIYLNYEWLSDSGGFYINDQSTGLFCPDKTTKYYLNATGNCVVSVSDSVEVSVAGCEVFIPNAFSPDNDNQNDFFYIEGYNIKLKSFQIYDRIGNLVFESNNNDNKWDGTWKNEKVTKGIYVYYTEYTVGNSSHIVKQKGNITLIK